MGLLWGHYRKSFPKGFLHYTHVVVVVVVVVVFFFLFFFSFSGHYLPYGHHCQSFPQGLPIPLYLPYGHFGHNLPQGLPLPWAYLEAVDGRVNSSRFLHHMFTLWPLPAVFQEPIARSLQKRDSSTSDLITSCPFLSKSSPKGFLSPPPSAFLCPTPCQMKLGLHGWGTWSPLGMFAVKDL